MANAGRSIVVFDLGGVLIDWDPRHLYRKLFAGDEAAMEHFLTTVCTHEWNRCRKDDSPAVNGRASRRPNRRCPARVSPAGAGGRPDRVENDDQKLNRPSA
jgi:hypothetical protein